MTLDAGTGRPGPPQPDLDQLDLDRLDLDQLRADTAGVGRVIHLNNAGAALAPQIVTDTVVAHLRREEEIGGYEAHREAQSRVDAVYASIATMLHTTSPHIALADTATTAWDRAMLSIPWGRSDRVLVASSEYASNVLPFIQMSRRHGLRVEAAPDGPDGTLDITTLSDMLDDDVRCVAITHMPSQNGLINDAVAVGAVLDDFAQRAGVRPWYLLDACQSAGQIPLDVAAIGCDFLSATGRKFLRGPRGTGFLYASDRAFELEPFPLDLHSATWTDLDSYTISAGARRFEQWEKSYAAVLGLGAAVDYAAALGFDAIRTRIALVSEGLRERLRVIPGLRVHDRGDRNGPLGRSGIVTFTLESTASAEIVDRLRAGGADGRPINASVSTPDYALRDFLEHGLGAVVRLSPHVYNSDDELDQAAEVISQL